MVYNKHHMKPQFNKTWLWISLIIIFNIFVFYFMSERLESYVAQNVANSKIENGL